MSNGEETGLRDKTFVCSWSGGKDSCFAFHRALLKGGRPRALLTMMSENGLRTRSHGLPLSVVEKQAEALEVPLFVRSASWEEYEEVFISALEELRSKGIEYGVFGDIDLLEHREWEEKVCRAAGLNPYLPLWQENPEKLLAEFLGAGFEAIIVALKASLLSRNFLGRRLDEQLIAELTYTGVDVVGESGEFHTVVTDGPPFTEPVVLRMKEQRLHSGYWFQDLEVV